LDKSPDRRVHLSCELALYERHEQLGELGGILLVSGLQPQGFDESRWVDDLFLGMLQ
jgi:hypothetical protein